MEIKNSAEYNFYPLDIVLNTGEATPENPSTNISATPISNDNIIRAASGSVLIDGVLQSLNFVKGSSGWIIRASGTVELGDGVFRGTITATAGFIGGFTIDATTIYSAGNEIVLDSDNKRIEVGASDEIVIDGDNKKITVGASDEITIDGANKKIESSNYVAGYAGAGFHLSSDLLEVGNIVARGLLRSAVFQKDIINVMGGNFMVLDGDILDLDMTALDASTLKTKATTTFAVGDFLRIKDGTDDEWLEVIAGIVDSYSESNQSQEGIIYSGSTVKMGQSFTGNGNVINSGKLYLKKSGSPTGNAIMTIYAHTGTFGAGGTPTGAILATSDNFDVSTLTTNFALITFNFTGANKITLTNGTKYFVTLEYSGGDASNNVRIGVDNTSPSHNGNAAYYVSSWIALTDDICFYLYGVGNPYTVTRDKKGDYGADANPAWKKGVAVANYKQSGDGGIYLTASETNAPYFTIFTHAGAPWTTINERLRLGNLNGIGGFVADVYGAFIGDKSTGNYLSYDDGSGELVVGAAKIIKGYTTGVALTAGQAVLMHTDGKVYPTNARIVNVVNQFLGFCLEDTAVATTAPIQIFGDVTELSSLTTASVYYISNSTHSSDVTQNNSDTGNTALGTGYTNWQSFKPTGDTISQITINVSNAAGTLRTYDVKLYSGEGIGTSLGEATSAAIPLGGAANDVSAVFDVPIAVTAGNTYTFSCKASGDCCKWSEQRGSDDYADGRDNNNSAYDYRFSTSKINSFGAIGTGAGTNSKKVGIATSATTLALKDAI